MKKIEKPTVFSVGMVIPKSSDKSYVISDLIHLANELRLTHWASTTLEEHLAVEECEDAIREALDRLVETAQTKELLNISIRSCTKPVSIEESLRQGYNSVSMGRDSFEQFSASIFDDVQEAISKCMYKLRFLK